MKFKFPQQHRRWLSWMAAGLILLFLQPFLGEALVVAQVRAGKIAEDRAQIEKSVRRFHEDLHLAQSPAKAMDSQEINRLLLPVDRLGVAKELEKRAASARLSHFTYALTPQKATSIEAVDAKDMTESTVFIEADAPMDIDAAGFLQNLNYALPGRVQLRHLVLTRKFADSLSLENIHMVADLAWLSNGEAR